MAHREARVQEISDQNSGTYRQTQSNAGAVGDDEAFRPLGQTQFPSLAFSPGSTDQLQLKQHEEDKTLNRVLMAYCPNTQRKSESNLSSDVGLTKRKGPELHHSRQ